MWKDIMACGFKIGDLIRLASGVPKHASWHREPAMMLVSLRLNHENDHWDVWTILNGDEIITRYRHWVDLFCEKLK